MKHYPVRETITSFIDGVFVAPSLHSHRIEVINPSTESVMSTLFEAGTPEVHQAVLAARRAFEDGRWHRLPQERRIAVLRRISELSLQHADELCYLESVDLGMPISHGHAAVISRVVRNFNFYADHLSQATERAVRLDDMYQRYVHRDPVGVCALLSPWNAPLMLATSKIAPALAFGNCCVLKVSEYTPLTIARFMELLIEAGVPPGVVNLVNGRGQVTGSSLVEHPEVDIVSFTGGGLAGRSIAASAGRHLKKCDLELGGKSANIVSDSANLDLAIEGSLMSIYSNTGQMCFAGSRILVQRGIANEFLERFTIRARQMVVGDPLNPATEMGPLAYAAHRDRVLAYCQPQAGVTVLSGGEALERPGYFVQPTVLLAETNDVAVCQEEIFGPVATVLLYDDFEEALHIANQTRYGLAGYVWTDRLSEMTAASQRLRTGALMINSPMVFDLRMPFGGYKESGIGREGIEGMRALYSEEKSVAIGMRPIVLPRHTARQASNNP